MFAQTKHQVAKIYKKACLLHSQETNQIFMTKICTRQYQLILKKQQDAREALTRATWACVCKSTQHNVYIYRNLKACVYIEVKANIYLYQSVITLILFCHCR